MIASLLVVVAAVAPMGMRAEMRSCGPLSAIEQEYAASSVVLVGQVVAITKQLREWPEPDVTGERLQLLYRVATIQVEKRWKGAAAQTIDVQTCEQCTVGVQFELGERWVVFAGGEQPATSDCGRTLLESDPRYPVTVEWLEKQTPIPLANIQMQPTRRATLDGARLIWRR